MLAILFSLLLIVAFVGVGGVLYAFYHYGRGLPAYAQLADYEPPTVTRVHAGDGRLLAEYATEKRVYVPVSAIPRRVSNAFLSAEDKNFYNHPGVDFLSVTRAVVTNVANFASGRRPVGASTITQQVAKNFLLTNEVSYERKIKEAILAFRIEQAFTKETILELYLNEIYLGFGSYGVAAAALNYFNKSLDELTVAEAAYLAALPKAPNNYHPIRRYDAAVARRNWVIGRMLEDGRIDQGEAEAARAEPLIVRKPGETQAVQADYFAEETRRELARLYGDDGLYAGGLSVRTTLDPRLQDIANRALRAGLIAYDRRHGWRGPLAKIDIGPGADVQAALQGGIARPIGIDDSWQIAVVTSTDAKQAAVLLAEGRAGQIPMAELKWARPWKKGQRFGGAPKKPSDVLEPGDVVLVETMTENAKGVAYDAGTFGLRQVPDVDGGIVALDPHTGRVLAMAGGYSYARSEFNRVMQARRQPGSAFKPFVYLAGLDSGFTPATLILDAPFVLDQGVGLGKWKPANYTKKFYGPTPMRVGIEKSRNLMTVRLAQTVGMEKIVGYARRFGVMENMDPLLSMSLGAGETTLMKITTAYAMLVNGGRRISPTLIDRVQDRHGRTIYRHDLRDCEVCVAEVWTGQAPPQLPDEREQVANPASAYQVVGMLQGVVQRGTGRRIAELGRPLAGKTGTSNDNVDTWFVGFSPDLAVGVFVGFDEPRTLGLKDTGSNVAAPLFKAFMAEALAGQPSIPFRIPPGISLVRMNAETGQLARPGDRRIFLEAFQPGTEPSGRQVVLDGGYNPSTGSTAASGTGGLY
ncbi:penicillin-binding protein 1A [Pelagibius litoralis]|uniref:Penicillin-binding protein 1A n=1 Tax=Pelagibius litoralis TaxID=374515 RepID=A0A967EVZ1_9PROT|nr:penicillin-binding protein 1A [Pelagibius litoralis]